MIDNRICDMLRIVEEFRQACLAVPEMVNDANNMAVGRSKLLIDALIDMPMFTPAQREPIIDAAWRAFREAFATNKDFNVSDGEDVRQD